MLRLGQVKPTLRRSTNQHNDANKWATERMPSEPDVPNFKLRLALTHLEDPFRAAIKRDWAHWRACILQPLYCDARQNVGRPLSHWFCVQLVANIGRPLRSFAKFEINGVRASIPLFTAAHCTRFGGCCPCTQTCLALWHRRNLQSVWEGRVSRQYWKLANLPKPHYSCQIWGNHNLIFLHYRSSNLSFRHFGIRISKLRKVLAS